MENKYEKYLPLLLFFTATGITLYFMEKKKGTKPKKTTGNLSEFNSKLRDIALKEYQAWGKGTIKEGSAITLQRLRDYYLIGAGVKNLTNTQMINTPWSAVFISYIMKMAGAGNNFPYAMSHNIYIQSAIKNKKLNQGKPFTGYKTTEMPLNIGDIAVYPRQPGITYDTTGFYKSHGDVVVGFEPGYAITIGGNVSNSVNMTKIPVTDDGFIDRSTNTGKRYIAIIKNTL